MAMKSSTIYQSSGLTIYTENGTLVVDFANKNLKNEENGTVPKQAEANNP